MTFPLAYCPNGPEALSRLRNFFEQRPQDVVLATMDIPSRSLAAFAERERSGYCAYPDPHERARFWGTLLSERSEIRDDSIPSAYLSEMDQGLYGGLIGGDVRFLCDPSTGWISSMVPPVLSDWSEFEPLRLDTDHPWFQRYLRQLDIFRTAAEGKFGISHFILISGLNFVFELIGASQTYLDLSDRPETVGRAIELGFELNVHVQGAFFDKVPLLEGGTCSNMAQWIPGRIVSESVDPFHMTSVDYFERWGRENLERVFARFDGGVLHLHANGRHLLNAVSSLAGLRGICLSDDTGFPTSFEILAEARTQAGELPLIVKVDYTSFCEALNEQRLTGGVLYQVYSVPDLDTANRCMDRVRDYRA